MLVTLNEVLQDAHKNNYAVGAFNINNLEILEAIMTAAEEENSPVIISTSEGAIAYAGMEELASLVHIKAEKADVPVVLHLDHGKDLDTIDTVIESGMYTSVMYDGSALPYEKNVANTQNIVEKAHRNDIPVEAELGAIEGIEDFVSVEEKDAHLTNPKQAVEYVEKTNCDALAVAVGTSHGAYKFEGESQLDFDRLREIKEKVDMPLVLHGASGVPEDIKSLCMEYGCAIEQAKGVADEDIAEAVSCGINKINIDTDLRIAFDAAVRKFLKENPEVFDPRKILTPAKELMTHVVKHKMNLFGCAGKA
jgi:fructose-bisphosphate aldolase class II